MSKQYHFVVCYDNHNKTWTMDYETQDSKFGGAPIYNSEINEWETLTSDIWEDDDSIYNRAGDLLAKAVNDLVGPDTKGEQK